MDRSTAESSLLEILYQSAEDRRRKKAKSDVIHLASRLLKEKFNPQIKAMLVKAARFESGRGLQLVACVVCGGEPEPVWKALGTDPEKTGMHCDAHKAEFHSVCETTYNCCDEPYDPDRDYEWRAPSEPQE